LRQKYLEYVHEMADRWLDWKKLGPMAEYYHALISADVKADTRKLHGNDEFESSLAELRSFAEKRRAFLLKKSEASSTGAGKPASR
jgi:hypothetical protein